MQVLSVRCGLTKNLGNYESAKLEIEAAPSDGQPADQLLAEVNEYLQKQVEAAVAASGGVKEKQPAKKKTADAPLKGAKSNPTTAGTTTESATPTTPAGSTDGATTEDAPFNADSAPNAEPGDKPAPKASKSSKKAERQAASAKKAADNAHKKELQYALDSETLDELLARFNSVRRMAGDFDDAWEAAVTKIADRYRKLNSLDANPETLDQLVKAFKAERQAIEKSKGEAVAA